jgi:hypothetical protein
MLLHPEVAPGGKGAASQAHRIHIIDVNDDDPLFFDEASRITLAATMLEGLDRSELRRTLRGYSPGDLIASVRRTREKVLAAMNGSTHRP